MKPCIEVELYRYFSVYLLGILRLLICRVFVIVLETYVRYLINCQQSDAVPPYLVHLCQARRIALFVELLNSVSLPPLPIVQSNVLKSTTHLGKGFYGDINLNSQGLLRLGMSGDFAATSGSEETISMVNDNNKMLLNQAISLFPSDVHESLKLVAAISRAGPLPSLLPSTGSFQSGFLPGESPQKPLSDTLQQIQSWGTPSKSQLQTPAKTPFSATRGIATTQRKPIRSRIATPFARKSLSIGFNTPGGSLRELDEEAIVEDYASQKICRRTSKEWIDSLYWLYLKDSAAQRLEAYQETNRLFLSLVLKQRETSLNRCVRSNHLEKQLTCFEEVYNRYGQDYICPMALSRDQSDLGGNGVLSDEDVVIWKVEVDKLLFWNSYFTALKVDICFHFDG